MKLVTSVQAVYVAVKILGGAAVAFVQIVVVAVLEEVLG